MAFLCTPCNLPPPSPQQSSTLPPFVQTPGRSPLFRGFPLPQDCLPLPEWLAEEWPTILGDQEGSGSGWKLGEAYL